MLKSITAEFSCDRCGSMWTEEIDPACRHPGGWAPFEIAQDHIRRRGYASTNGVEHFCESCTRKSDALKDDIIHPVEEELVSNTKQHGCTNGFCWMRIGPVTGQHTNGPCNCLRDIPFELQQAIKVKLTDQWREIMRLSEVAIDRNGKIIELTDALALQAEEAHDEITRLTADLAEAREAARKIIELSDAITLQGKQMHDEIATVGRERDSARDAARWLYYHALGFAYEDEELLARWPWLQTEEETR